MKLLIYGVNFAPELTSTGKYSGEMATWLAGRGHEVVVVTAPPYYPAWRVDKGYSAWRYRRESIDGVRVWRCPLWVPARPSGLTRIVHLASFAATSFPIILLLGLRRPDVVLVIEPALACAPGALLATCLGGGKAWLHVQDFEIDAAFALGLVRSDRGRRCLTTLERWLMRRFERVSTISGRMLERLDAKGVPTERRVLFPNWVEPDSVYPLTRPSMLREKLGIGPDEIVALYAGNMGEKQGLDIVIEAARLLESQAGLRFVMCGNGAAHERLRGLGAALKNVTWLPVQPVELLNELLNLADVHLLPQRPDAADLVMPSKLTGILASGRPVVATARPGTEVWSVVEGRGVNTPPGNASAFAEAIRALAVDVPRRASLGAAGRRYAEEILAQDVVLRRFEKDLLEVARPRS